MCAHPPQGAFSATNADVDMSYFSSAASSRVAMQLVVDNQGRGHWSTAETVQNTTMGCINEGFGSCCVGQGHLYTPDALCTSMREGLKRITATITESLIHNESANAQADDIYHIMVFSERYK
ncbi:hypothetical protein BDM02DRAFT_3113366 [Thelephora ganbajun]|uniref:Uncharacterized protein n=1 Tax=Thelephora ganbajun TaxID=370292 RepID=A0ACB6ZJK5_THEGA|nr:hypothetical protein BDM02DRAFT_3113366 [Thelephora ganbajun]